MVAPVSGSPDGPMPGQIRTRSTCQQSQTIIQSRGQPMDSEGVDAGSRKLDSERDPVQLATNPRCARCVLVVQLEIVHGRCGTFSEELNRRKPKSLNCAELGRRRWALKRG